MTSPAELEQAEEHFARQAALAVLALREAVRAWARVAPANLSVWPVLAARLAPTLAAVQYAAARDAAGHIGRLAGDRAPAAADVVPAAFAGVASDGRPLLSLLDQPRITVLTRIGQGVPAPRAMQMGRTALETIAATQVQDAGRAAAAVAMTARRGITGYVRQLRQPSCSRCAVLAGQFYRWNAGFLRHPRCDCRHVPVIGDRYPRVTSPREYFDSLPRVEQNRIFTNAGAEAIRLGADPGMVVNARRGMYEAGGRLYTRESTGRRGVVPGRQRAMPETLIQAAGGDRDEAIRLLQTHGYLRAPAAAARPMPGGGLGGGGGGIGGQRTARGRGGDDSGVTAPARQRMDALLEQRREGGPDFDEEALDAAAALLQRARAAFEIRGQLDHRHGEAFTADESRTVTKLLDLKYNVTKIPANRTSTGRANPDIYLDGVRADLKAYSGGSWERLSEGIADKLQRQASLVVVELRGAAARLDESLVDLAVREALAGRPNARVLVIGGTYHRQWPRR